MSKQIHHLCSLLQQHLGKSNEIFTSKSIANDPTLQVKIEDKSRHDEEGLEGLSAQDLQIGLGRRIMNLQQEQAEHWEKVQDLLRSAGVQMNKGM